MYMCVCVCADMTKGDHTSDLACTCARGGQRVVKYCPQKCCCPSPLKWGLPLAWSSPILLRNRVSCWPGAHQFWKLAGQQDQGIPSPCAHRVGFTSTPSCLAFYTFSLPMQETELRSSLCLLRHLPNPGAKLNSTSKLLSSYVRSQ